MKKNWLLIIGLVLVLDIVGLAGCTSEKPPVSHGGPVTDYVSDRTICAKPGQLLSHLEK